MQTCALSLCPLMGSSGCPICAVPTEKYFVVCSMSGFKFRLFALLCVLDKFRCDVSSFRCADAVADVTGLRFAVVRSARVEGWFVEGSDAGLWVRSSHVEPSPPSCVPLEGRRAVLGTGSLCLEPYDSLL